MEGVWRDRMNLFLSYRQSFPRSIGHESERAGLMLHMDQGVAVVEMDLLPPRWLDVQDDVAAALDRAKGQMRKLDQLHAKHVLPGFDDESVKAAEEREIAAITADITRAFTSCQHKIRTIDALARDQPGLSQADQTMARNLQIALAARVGDASTSFRKKQTAYLKKLRGLGGMGAATDRSSTPVTATSAYSDLGLADSETDRASAQSTLLQTAQVRRRGVMDSTIEQREREIEGIAQGVIDLSALFQELNTMIIDQGTLLDRVDYNVQRTVDHVRGAEKELRVATGYQKRNTKRKIILLLLLIVVGLVILLATKPSRRRRKRLSVRVTYV
ncbi:t-SNARE [Piedraia hortae CBS 480.64]|uniref:t-SNARE n=1 Tax=Piedraia hortae CBS 480.64 TaxID=1314780 RepID=A0A6A7C5F6_9PEZI|nr:t-SNARE [Piedraia hortae CBS 480.64]